MAASSSLLLHAGARLVDLDELASVKAPPPERRWHPVAHVDVLNRVKDTLGEAGYVVRAQKLALSKDNAKFFGTLDLETPLVSGVSLAVGVRNSIDRSICLNFCAGSRTFVCDNMAFRADLLVKKKHTQFGQQRFSQAIAEAVMKLGSFKDQEAERIKQMMRQEVSADVADAVILRAFERGIVGAHHLPGVIKEWRNPSFEEFRPRTVWSLMNAFTTVLGPRAVKQPHRYAVQTMRLHRLLEPPKEGPPTSA
jgi:hypothetical protein